MELHFNVAQAVHVLNHDTQSCNRLAANQWLVQFQQTDAAWEIATSILTSDLHNLFHSDHEVDFFAAQILKRKIQNEGHNLHLGAKDALLRGLLVAAKRFSLGPPQLLTLICIALSTLVLHVVELPNPIEKLFYSLQDLQRQENGNNAVLEMLTILPEVIEDQSSDCRITSAQCSEYGQELLAHTPMVLEFLVQQFKEVSGNNAHPCDRSRKILRCLLSWIDGDDEHSLRQNLSTYMELINTAVRGLHRIGTVFHYLATHLQTSFGPDETILTLLEVFWPILEKLFLSKHIENASLSTAACRALTLAIQASGFNASRSKFRDTVAKGACLHDKQFHVISKS